MRVSSQTTICSPTRGERDCAPQRNHHKKPISFATCFRCGGDARFRLARHAPWRPLKLPRIRNNSKAFYEPYGSATSRDRESRTRIVITSFPACAALFLRHDARS